MSMDPLLEKKAQWGGSISINSTTMKRTITILLLMMCVMAAAQAQKVQDEPAINWTTPAATSITDDNTITINHDAIVLYHYSNYLYLKYEDSGSYSYCLVYGTVGQNYRKGDVIPGGFGGRLTIYSGEEEITQPYGFQPPIGHVDVVPDDITVTDINHDYWAHYVSLKQVTVSDLQGMNFKITDAEGNEAVGFNRFGQAVENGFYEELNGIVGSYGRNDNIIYELLPIIEQETFTVNCLDDLYELGPGKIGQIRLKAIYQFGVYMFVQDFCGQFGLVFGSTGIQISNGDIIEGICTPIIYSGNYQLAPIGNWEVISHGPSIEPVELTIEELSIDMVHYYVKIYDVEFVEGLSPNTCLMRDPTGEITVYNRFVIDIPFNRLNDSWESREDVNQDGEVNIADVNRIIEEIITGKHETIGRNYVIGFVSVYHGELEFYPIKIVNNKRLRCDVNEDGEVNISDLNWIIDYIIRH